MKLTFAVQDIDFLVLEGPYKDKEELEALFNNILENNKLEIYDFIYPPSKEYVDKIIEVFTPLGFKRVDTTDPDALKDISL